MSRGVPAAWGSSRRGGGRSPLLLQWQEGVRVHRTAGRDLGSCCQEGGDTGEAPFRLTTSPAHQQPRGFLGHAAT